jgi:3-O-methylgallate 3,4-dioxygenase
MATIVGAIGTSHSPMLLTNPRLWRERAAQDRTNTELYDNAGRHVSFDELSAAVGERFAAELSDEVWEQRYTACLQGMDRLAADLAELRPDVLVVVGDDQEEVFDATNQPSMAIFWGDTWETGTMEGAPPGEFFEAVKTGYAMDAVHKFDGHPQLALDAITGLVAREFDVASVASTPPGHGFGHAYGFIIQRLLGERTDVPVVPVMLNTYYPPNQPTPKRSYELGRAIRNAVEAWPEKKRVAILASGGLSHFVVDEELDTMAMEGMKNKDIVKLQQLPRERLNSGNSEIRNWILVAGATEHLDLKYMNYVPSYRSEAGTGCAMAFAEWG